jgi:hypothetical protein
MEIIRNYEERIAALELQKQKLEKEREELLQQLVEQFQAVDAQKRTAKFMKLVNGGIRLGMTISKPGHEGKWIDITESAVKLVTSLQ